MNCNKIKHTVSFLIFYLINFQIPLAETPISQNLAICAAISGALERLNCFDNLTKKFHLNAPQPQAVSVKGTGKWIVTKDKNPIDDSDRVALMLTADDGNSKWGGKITLITRCLSNKTDLYINWGNYLGDDDSSPYEDWKYVTIRIGKNSAEKQKWSVSTDQKATFAPSPVPTLLKKLISTNSFLAQTTPYGESPVTALFDTTGLENALKPLRDVCGW